MAARLLPGPFTVEMYHKLGELGVFDEDDRVELLDGQIVEMTPIGQAHWMTVFRLSNLLMRHSTSHVGVSTQSSLVLSERWEPEPDIAVLRRLEGFGGAWLPAARDVILVIEVADTSLERDRDIKIPRYAYEGIAEAWLIDVHAETVTCYRGPTPEGYAEAVVVKRGETLRPTQWPSVAISVDEVFG